jgi:uncharacterized membrane protein
MTNLSFKPVNQQLQKWGIPIFILLIATFLRFHWLDHQSFWNDEGNSARLSERSIILIIEGTASDIHPPLYYLFLRGWQELVGASEFGLRSFSAFVGVLVVAFTLAFGRLLDNRWVAWLAGFFAAVSPPLIYYSQEARMYSLLGLEAIATTLFLYLWLNKPAFKWRMAYIVGVTAGLYTHYFFPAVLLAHYLYLAGWLWQHKAQWPDKIMEWREMFLLPWFLYAWWLPTFWRSTGGGAGPAEMTDLYGLSLQQSLWVITGPFGHFGFLAALLLTNGFALAFTRRLTFRPRPAGFLIFWWAAMPLIFMNLVGATEQQHLKFLITAVPAFCLAQAIYLGDMLQARLKEYRQDFVASIMRFLGAAVLMSTIALLGSALYDLYFRTELYRADYRAIAQRITAENHPTAGVILNAPNQWEVFTYYYSGPAAVYPFPKVRSSEAEIVPQLEQMMAEHGRVYLIIWGEGGFDPERAVERWLDAHAFKAVDEWYKDVRLVMYALPPAVDQPPTEIRWLFGENISLTGYSLPITELLPGDVLPLTLIWQTERPLEQRYKVFLHLVDEAGNLVAQRDSEPGGNLIPTTIWQPGESIEDKHGVLVPMGTPAGVYQLRLGLYDLADPTQRLQISSPAGVTDFVVVGQVVVR